MTYASEVAADSPVLWWRLGEASGTTATDASGNARHGTYVGSPTLGVASLLVTDANTAVQFDGVNDYVSGPAPATTSAFTVEFWMSSYTAGSPLATRYPSSSGDRIFFIGLGSGGDAGKVRFTIRNAAGTEIAFAGTTIVTSGGPHHVVCTYDGSAARIYINGALENTSTVVTGALSSATPNLEIGARSVAAAFAGAQFDEAALYSTALSGARILAHYAAATSAPADQNISPGFAASDGAAYAVTLSQPSVEVSEVERPIPGRRLYPAPQIRVGGMWLSTIAGWGDLEVKHGRNGPFEATWNMALGDTERPSPLIRNARVEVYAGPTMVWCGALGQPDWDAKSFAAIGIARQAEGAECMTSGGAITSKPNTAIDQAAARDVVWWTRAGDFGNTDIAGVEGDVSNDDPDPGKLTDLLDLWARENDSQWRVTADGRLVIDPEDETEPDWLILPGVGVLGEADDDVADRVFIRYNDSTAGKIRYASYPASTPANGIERRGSVVKRGPMSASRALAIATGMYRQAQAGRIGWTNGIEVTDQQIITKGGHPANLALIRAGQTVRMLDTPDPRNGGRNLDFVIGESTWRPVERTVQLNPVGMVKRTWEELLADNRLEAA